MAAIYKLPTVKYGSKGPHVAMVQGFLNSQFCYDENGRVLVCDGDSGQNTMFAVKTYIEKMAAKGVDLGSPDGFGPLCYASMGLDKA